MPDHGDSLGGETFSGEEQQDPAEQSLGDGHTMSGDTAGHSLGDQGTLGDANVDEAAFDDGMEIVDLSIRYTEEGVLGKGGFGEVMLATDKRLNRKVAIKRIQGKAARSKKAVHRFLIEAQSIAALSHNNIVQIYDYGRATDGPFLIMECVQGGSLLDRLKKGKLNPEKAIRITCQVCDALTLAHAKGIIHRDIKPANVLMTEDDVPKLTDFGLAKRQNEDHGQTAVGVIMGTIDFMPPEQRRDSRSVDERSDLWSLAAVSYQMLTGNSPKVIRVDKLPTNIASVLGRMLEEDPNDRYLTASDFKKALQKAAPSDRESAVVDLVSGECPACNTVNNETRKYCRGCRASLRQNCLACEKNCPVWDDICGECGLSQEDEIEKLSVLVQEKRFKAIELLDKNEHNAAMSILKKLKIPNHPLTSHLLETQNAWQQEIQVVFDRRKQQIEDSFSSVKHLDANLEYSQIISVLEAVPEGFRTSQISNYLKNALSQRKHIQTLRHQFESHFSEYKNSQARDVVQWETTVVGLMNTIKLLGESSDHEYLQNQDVKASVREIEQLETIYSEAVIAEKNQEYSSALEKVVGANQTLFITDKGESIRRGLEETIEAGRELEIEINNLMYNKRFDLTLKLLEKYRNNFSKGAKFSGLDETLKDRIELKRKFADASLGKLSLVELRSFYTQFDALADYLTCDRIKDNLSAIGYRIKEIADERADIVRSYEDNDYVGLLSQINKLRPFLREDKYFAQISTDLNLSVPCLNIDCDGETKKGQQSCVHCSVDQELKYQEIDACLSSSYSPSHIGEAIATYNMLVFVRQKALKYYEQGCATVCYPQESRISDKISFIYKKWFSHLVKNAKAALALYHFDEVIEILPLTITIPEADEIRGNANYGNKIMTELVERYHTTSDQLQRASILHKCLQIFPGHLAIQARLEKQEKIQRMIQRRQSFIVEGDVSSASKILDVLIKMGITIEDTAEGTLWTSSED